MSSDASRRGRVQAPTRSSDEAEINIRRAFARSGDRVVHYRHAGAGPALVLLHQSPQNSSMWRDQIARFAKDYLVIAPDLPGFGWTDPLPLTQPSIADLSAACHELLDVLGIDRCAVFGMHTGGIVAVHMGLDRPERVGLVLVDGYAIFNDAERALLGERYLPPFVPDWSGQHLRWLWARMREQSFFFPWCEQGEAYALSFPAPDVAKTQAAVMDILEVGDQYRLGYGAALRFADRACVAELAMPARLIYREDDVLIAHRERLPALPGHISAPRLADRATLWDEVGAALAAWSGPGQEIHTPQPAAGWDRVMISTVHGELAAWVFRPEVEAELVRLELHGPGQMPATPTGRDVADQRAEILVRPDLPGHGASNECTDAALSLAGMSECLVELCRRLIGEQPLVLQANAGAAGLALALIERLPGKVAELLLVNPWLLSADERQWLLAHLPDLSPRPAGGHLLEAWQWERERHLFHPWKPPSGPNRLPGPAPDVEQVHANTVALVGLGSRLAPMMAELLPPDLQARIETLELPVQIQYSPQGLSNDE